MGQAVGAVFSAGVSVGVSERCFEVLRAGTVEAESDTVFGGGGRGGHLVLYETVC